MLVAVALVHWQKGFFLHSGGYEYNLVLAGSALGLAFTGPGAFSLDSLLGLSWGESWGVAALIAGVVAGATVLFMRSLAHRLAAPGGTPQPQA